jgi:diguanylate cyclase (GGDEF)-like protein/PAS domain S-box-containing protein
MKPRRAKSTKKADSAALVHARAETEAAMAQARQADIRLREAIDILPHGLVFLDPQGRYILWNQQYADIYRRSADLFQPGIKLEDTLRIGVARGDYPEAIGREEEWLAHRISLLFNPSGRHEQRLADGRVVMIEERRTSDGGVIGLRVDITDLKRREDSFRLLFDGNPIPMFVCGVADQRMLAVNDAAIDHYGYDRQTLLGMRIGEIHDDNVAEDLMGLYEQSVEEQGGRTWKHRKADGSIIDVAIFSRRLTYEGQEALLIAATDITERKRAEARVAFMAHHDALTSLPNRILLRLRMKDMLARIHRNSLSAAALCIDLDNFKAVNDTLGHPFGDLLLQAVGDRLRSLLREQDTVARLGGDEFAILQCDVAQPEQVSALAQRLLRLVGEPYDLDGHQITISASIGIALAPGDANDADRLLKNADMALYRAKADGKGTFRFFEAEMDARVQKRLRLEMDLRAALHAKALQVHYQPIVDLNSGGVNGFEALIRWPHPERGMIPPTEFIPVAEEMGLIAQIGAFVLHRACTDAAGWPDHIKIAINLSALQFRHGDLLSVVMGALRNSGLPPRRLELEITETVLLEKSEHMLETLKALRSLGVRISMDDFGTGYSSLSYLRSFPFDKIKIDRSFVRDLSNNADSQAIVRAIVGLGKSLGMTITAEGIEDETHLARLRAEGCNEGQGYLFSHARPLEEIEKLLRREKVKVA